MVVSSVTLVFTSCEKEKISIEKDPQLQERTNNFPVYSASLISQAQSWSVQDNYYSNLVSTTASTFDALLGDSTKYNYIRCTIDSINSKRVVDHYSFSTKSAYLSFTDGTLGQNQTLEFSRDEAVAAMLARHGLTNATSLPTWVEDSVNAIYYFSSWLPFTIIYDFCDWNNQANNTKTCSNFLLDLGTLDKKPSSFDNQDYLLKPRDIIYRSRFLFNRIATIDSDAGVHRHGLCGTSINNRARSWRKGSIF